MLFFKRLTTFLIFLLHSGKSYCQKNMPSKNGPRVDYETITLSNIKTSTSIFVCRYIALISRGRVKDFWFLENLEKIYSWKQKKNYPKFWKFKINFLTFPDGHQKRHEILGQCLFLHAFWDKMSTLCGFLTLRMFGVKNTQKPVLEPPMTTLFWKKYTIGCTNKIWQKSQSLVVLGHLTNMQDKKKTPEEVKLSPTGREEERKRTKKQLSAVIIFQTGFSANKYLISG